MDQLFVNKLLVYPFKDCWVQDQSPWQRITRIRIYIEQYICFQQDLIPVFCIGINLYFLDLEFHYFNVFKQIALYPSVQNERRVFLFEYVCTYYYFL